MNIFKRLKVPGPLQTFRPDTPRAESDKHPVVNLTSTEFLVTQEAMAQNVSVEELSALIKAAGASLRATISNSPLAFHLRLRFPIYPDRPVGIDIGLDAPREQLDSLAVLNPAYDALQQMPERNVFAREHPVVLAAHFAVEATK